MTMVRSSPAMATGKPSQTDRSSWAIGKCSPTASLGQMSLVQLLGRQTDQAQIVLFVLESITHPKYKTIRPPTLPLTAPAQHLLWLWLLLANRNRLKGHFWLVTGNDLRLTTILITVWAFVCTLQAHEFQLFKPCNKHFASLPLPPLSPFLSLPLSLSLFPVCTTCHLERFKIVVTPITRRCYVSGLRPFSGNLLTAAFWYPVLIKIISAGGIHALLVQVFVMHFIITDQQRKVWLSISRMRPGRVNSSPSLSALFLILKNR